jgi:hypothetical protein
VSPNEVAIRKAVARLADAFQPWPPRRTEAFVKALEDLWPEDVDAGVTAALREWTFTKSPAPGYVRERCLACRAGRSSPTAKPGRGPVGWDQARTPLTTGSDGYLRDAEGRRVMLPAKPFPQLQRTTWEAPDHVPEDWESV